MLKLVVNPLAVATNHERPEEELPPHDGAAGFAVSEAAAEEQVRADGKVDKPAANAAPPEFVLHIHLRDSPLHDWKSPL